MPTLALAQFAALLTVALGVDPAWAQEPAPAEGEPAPAPVELQEEAQGGEAAPPETQPAPEAGEAPAEADAAGAGTATAGVSLEEDTSATISTTGSAGSPVPSSSGGGVMLGAEEATPASSGSGVDIGVHGGNDWKLGYHGFFRAPFRVGLGERDAFQRNGPALVSGPAPNAVPIGQLTPRGTPQDGSFDPGKAYKKTTIHAPLIPDDQYLSWQSTRHNATDWAEMFFTIGNEIAKGTLGINGYNFAQTSYSDPETQFGISQGYVEIKPPLPWQNVRLSMRAGSHWGLYGKAGRYDAGEYDTYLYGRTKVMGLTTREEIDVGPITLSFEEGFGGHRPHPSPYNTAKYTLLGHGHVFLQFKDLILGLHALHAWSQEEDRDGQGCPGPGGIDDEQGRPTSNGTCSLVWSDPNNPNNNAYNGTDYAVGSVSGFGAFADGAEANVWLPDGQMTILGPEIRWDIPYWGIIYLGFSHINAKDALTVSSAVEVQHSFGGGEFGLGVTNNFLDNPQCNAAKGECSSGGTGKVNTLEAQYEISLHNVVNGIKGGDRFWGDGWDLVLKLYGMYSQVSSNYDPTRDGSLGSGEPYGWLGAYYVQDHPLAEDNPAIAAQVEAHPDNQSPPNLAPVGGGYWTLQGDNYSKHSKLKFGTDLFANLFPAGGVGVRFDRVMPNNHLTKQSFSILSPRIELRSRWVTREKISFQYSRYMYDKRVCDQISAYNPYNELKGDEGFDYTGSPQNFTGMPANTNCAQYPSGPRLPDGWGATQLESGVRGAPITGTNGNPNNTRPDENIFKIEASMWW